jgi:hypothetical protein
MNDFIEKFRGDKTFYVTYLIIGEDLKTQVGLKIYNVSIKIAIKFLSLIEKKSIFVK